MDFKIITKEEVKKILYSDNRQKEENLQWLISKFGFYKYKFLSETVWGLDAPLLDHFIMFLDYRQKEFLVSNTYMAEKEVEEILNKRDDLEFYIYDHKSYYSFGTNLLVISKKKIESI